MGNEDARRTSAGREEPPPIEWVRPGESPPPAEAPPPSAAWVPRPEEFERQPPSRPARRPGGSAVPTIAAICLILAAFLGMAGALYSVFYPTSPEEIENLTSQLDPVTVTFLYVCSLVSVWAQAFALLGGIMAYQRTNWKLVLVCAVFSLFTLGFVYVEGSVLGAIGLFLVLVSRRDFTS